jgi:hypothetical protein
MLDIIDRGKLYTTPLPLQSEVAEPHISRVEPNAWFFKLFNGLFLPHTA